MPILPNPKHEAFCQHRAAGKTCDESYKLAGYKPDRHHAARLATNGHFVARIAELQAKAAIRAAVTIYTIADQLDEDRALAFKLGQASAAVAASVAKAKLLGLNVDRSVVTMHNYSQSPRRSFATRSPQSTPRPGL
jgi:hypothetical protein